MNVGLDNNRDNDENNENDIDNRSRERKGKKKWKNQHLRSTKSLQNETEKRLETQQVKVHINKFDIGRKVSLSLSLLHIV